MFHLYEKAILGMALLRILSGSLEIIVALMFLKYNNLEKALMLNSSLALVGPIILITTTTIGLFGIAEKISFAKLFWVFGGVACILYGVKSQ
ncbi:YqhV family protein [Bacillus benzoevorans]|uniref:Putative exporter of polyketide antibiotics n=1 Tax=Bacillus benzoevorans TaxID=1456 RepID=A0A7X0HT63_9BACI|nr:YqhV family protein [Bacillus benzoevorans]MBB6446374.1 putative exporter of polyketide antibiotics [Bacillus benzoevorans]